MDKPILPVRGGVRTLVPLCSWSKGPPNGITSGANPPVSLLCPDSRSTSSAALATGLARVASRIPAAVCFRRLQICEVGVVAHRPLCDL